MALTEAVSGDCSGLKECERVEIPEIASSGEDFCYNGEWRNGMVPSRDWGVESCGIESLCSTPVIDFYVPIISQKC